MVLPNYEGDWEKYSLSAVAMDAAKFPYHGGKGDGYWGITGCPFLRGSQGVVPENQVEPYACRESFRWGKEDCYLMGHEMCLCLIIRLIMMLMCKFQRPR